MAEPQTNTQPASRARSEGGQAAPAREPRSFDEGRAPAAVEDAQIAHAAADGARRIAETGRAVGQGAAEVWRRSFDPFLALQLDMNRWFDDLWRQALGFTPAAPQMLRPFGRLGAAGVFGLPPADLQETKDAQVLAIELPGLTPQDVDISLDADALTICGHKAEETQDASAAYRMSERRFGRFERSFPLPPDIDRGKISAQFRDGVLKITLPKDPEAAPRRSKIEIKA